MSLPPASDIKLSTQNVGNIGMFYVCYRLSKLGWNVMPTSRNARGIDIVAYSPDGSQFLGLQIKTLSQPKNQFHLARQSTISWEIDGSS